MLVALRAPNTSRTLGFDTLSVMTETAVSPSELSDWLIGRGRHFISSAEIAEMFVIDPASVPGSLERARRAGKLLSVTKGGWVPVPAEYRSAGAPPVSHFIDQLMQHLGHSYYVGFLSAAALHGASHQAPMVFQVATPAKLRERRIGRSRLRFIQRTATAGRPRRQHNVPTGRIWVSTPEVTLFDLVESPEEGGGLSNIATIIGELLTDQRLDESALAQTSQLYPNAVTQRVGYLLDLMASEVSVQFDTNELNAELDHARYQHLAHSADDGERNERWHIIANSEIEHDL